jgi:hypothetical protein
MSPITVEATTHPTVPRLNSLNPHGNPHGNPRCPKRPRVRPGNTINSSAGKACSSRATSACPSLLLGLEFCAQRYSAMRRVRGERGLVRADRPGQVRFHGRERGRRGGGMAGTGLGGEDRFLPLDHGGRGGWAGSAREIDGIGVVSPSRMSWRGARSAGGTGHRRPAPQVAAGPSPPPMIIPMPATTACRLRIHSAPERGKYAFIPF